MAEKEIYLIDGHALAYRAYFALINNPLVNSKGQPTSAVYGFANYLMRILQDFQCPYIAAVFDSPKPSFRKEIYPQYKANRVKMDEEMISQIPLIFQLVDCFNIPYIMQDGLEADDILAYLTRKAEKSGFKVYLITKDKDLMQLVSPNVHLLAPESGGRFTKIGTDEVIDKMGVPPEQILDLLSLMGDSSDNIPGIPGVGPKTAIKILKQTQSVDTLLADSRIIANPKLRKKLEENKELLLLSKKLVTLKYDFDRDINIEELKAKPINKAECVKFFKEMEFTSLLRNSFFQSQTKTNFSVFTPSNPNELADFISRIPKNGNLSIDTETTSLETRSALLVGISLAFTENDACYIPVGHDTGNNISINQVMSLLQPIIESSHISKIGQNLKYDYQIFKKYGLTMQGNFIDTMVAAYLIDPGKRQYGMDTLASQWLNIQTIPIEMLIGKGKGQKPFSSVSIADASQYAGEDAIIPFRLWQIFKPMLKERNSFDLFTSIEMPLIPVLAEMEWQGITIDTLFLDTLSQEYTGQLHKISREIYAIAGEQFNLNSPKQVSEVLFGKLGLPKVRKTKTGLSTDVTTLEKLAPNFRIARKLLDYREVQKLLSTYIDALPGQINKDSGRVHTSFNQTIAATGRLSSTNPNLQNIPIRTEAGRRIREAFIVPQDYTMVSADYSQIELRILAHLSEDEKLIQAFHHDQDIHAHTASAIYNCPVDAVTQEMRRTAKVINFGLMYGMGPINLSNQLNISYKEAQAFIEIYFKQFPTIKNYMEGSVQKARKTGYIETLLGRRRYLPDINSNNRRIREAVERIAINTPVQGTSADIIKIAMVQIGQELPKFYPDCTMVLQVHDELVFEVPELKADAFTSWVTDKMISAYTLRVPLKVDAGRGKNWSIAH